MRNHTPQPSLVPSRFAVVLCQDGLAAVVHQLQPRAVYLQPNVWQQIVKGRHSEVDERLIEDLVCRSLLLADVSEDDALEARVQDAIRWTLDRPTILYLMLAQDCNFACGQCPIPQLARRYGNSRMAFEQGVAGIRLWQESIADWDDDGEPFFLIFYGGEPLLNMAVFDRLLDYVAQEKRAGRLSERIRLMLTTNGAFVDDRCAQRLAEHDVITVIGLDGPPAHNDQLRVTAQGQPTFDVIRQAVETLHRHGVRVAASVACAPAHVAELHEYAVLMKELGIAQYGLNLMKGRALVQRLDRQTPEDYARQVGREVLLGWEVRQESGRPMEYQLDKSLAALEAGKPFAVGCTCYGNQLVVQADGQVTNCPFLRVDQGLATELPSSFRICQAAAVQQWRTRIPVFSNTLSEASPGLLDSGGCAWGMVESTGDITQRDAASAALNEEIMHGIIWKLLPREQADAIRSGTASHWCYRGDWSGDVTGHVR